MGGVMEQHLHGNRQSATVLSGVIGGLLVGGADSRRVLAQVLGALTDQHGTT